ncbi:hypothetical protein [Sulfurospirillum arsenophilum]|uniref:hypothetical protein n=1 Tax=Sulfurospirillum arsenophilum TaxID=56698 RepID=UPI000AB365E9|nr:hypothetical protein [Sulfurospirillum arsenophilum]
MLKEIAERIRALLPLPQSLLLYIFSLNLCVKEKLDNTLLSALLKNSKTITHPYM